MNMNNIKNNVTKSPFGGFREISRRWRSPSLWGRVGVGLFLFLLSCGNYLDIVPDGVATIDMAFNSREQALKYLFTCYSYMPKNGDPSLDPAVFGCDELYTVELPSSLRPFSYEGLNIGLGLQNATNVQLDYWGSLYQGIRNCNIFLENVEKVPDLMEWERYQWISEIKVLKAYYHFYLVQMYGPIPLVRENIPVSAGVIDVKVVREPVDECFQYIVELLDEATLKEDKSDNETLPLNVYDSYKELGRITRPIAMSLKAKILVTAASILFNANSDQETLTNRDGTLLFNQTYNPEKWQKAVAACAAAITICNKAGIKLYEFPNTGINKLTDTIATQMSLRSAFTERWNSEIIWANTQHNSSYVQLVGGMFMNPAWQIVPARNVYGVPLKIASMFYTDNGVPLAEDKTRDMDSIYELKKAKPEDKLYLRSGSTTIDLHFNREPRFYAWMGFDCGIWYGQGRTDDKAELWSMYGKRGESHGWAPSAFGPYTGYNAKKITHYRNVSTGFNAYSITPYPWPMMRLSDLFLLYAEAINELEGTNGTNSKEMYAYIDSVRYRAGLKGVKESWDASANNKKYNNQAGMRQIIQQERMIELVFEGHRFWDMRRWKIATDLYRTPIEKWSLTEWETRAYYTPAVLFHRDFNNRDYFWPIKNSDILNNRNLVQNIGW